MPTKQFIEKQIALEKEIKIEQKEVKEYYKDLKDKEKEKEKETEKEKHKEKEKEKEHLKDKEIYKEDRKEYLKEDLLEHLPQAKYPETAAAPSSEATPAGLSKIVETKQIAEKAIYKEFKVEKYEIKEHKDIKEHDKPPFFEGKHLVDFPTYPTAGGDPYAQRLAALEATVAQLVHFIPAELRPDLSQGALKQEPDAPSEATPAPPAPKDSKK
jgi:hypothetical protein